eukprot:1535387-Prorocentrum_lima.AAC.1
MRCASHTGRCCLAASKLCTILHTSLGSSLTRSTHANWDLGSQWSSLAPNSQLRTGVTEWITR